MHPIENTSQEKMYTISLIFGDQKFDVKDAVLNATDTSDRLKYLCSCNTHIIELENGNVLALPKDTHIEYYFVATLNK